MCVQVRVPSAQVWCDLCGLCNKDPTKAMIQCHHMTKLHKMGENLELGTRNMTPSTYVWLFVRETAIFHLISLYFEPVVPWLTLTFVLYGNIHKLYVQFRWIWYKSSNSMKFRYNKILYVLLKIFIYLKIFHENHYLGRFFYLTITVICFEFIIFSKFPT